MATQNIKPGGPAISLQDRFSSSRFNLQRPAYTGQSQFATAANVPVDRSGLNVDAVPARYNVNGNLSANVNSSDLNVDNIPPRYNVAGNLSGITNSSNLNVDTIPAKYNVSGRIREIVNTSGLNIDSIPKRYTGLSKFTEPAALTRTIYDKQDQESGFSNLNIDRIPSKYDVSGNLTNTINSSKLNVDSIPKRYSGLSKFTEPAALARTIYDTQDQQSGFSNLNIDRIPSRYDVKGRLFGNKDTSNLNLDLTPTRYAPKR